MAILFSYFEKMAMSTFLDQNDSGSWYTGRIEYYKRDCRKSQIMIFLLFAKGKNHGLGAYRQSQQYCAMKAGSMKPQ